MSTTGTPRTPGLEERSGMRERLLHIRKHARFLQKTEVSERNTDECAALILAEVDALLAAAPSGEPVAWLLTSQDGARATTTIEPWARDHADESWIVTPLYAGAAPAEREAIEEAYSCGWEDHRDGLPYRPAKAWAALAAASREQEPYSEDCPYCGSEYCPGDESCKNHPSRTPEPPAPGETRAPTTDEELEVRFTETFDELRGEGAFDALGLSVQADILRTVTRLFPITGTQRICAPTDEAARLAGCGICGGRRVEIRPKHPGGERRQVCPTCLADRMAMIEELAAPDYGVAFQEAP